MTRRSFAFLCVVCGFIFLTTQTTGYGWEICGGFGPRRSVVRASVAPEVAAETSVVRHADVGPASMSRRKVVTIDEEEVVVHLNVYYDPDTGESWYHYSNQDPDYEPIDDYS